MKTLIILFSLNAFLWSAFTVIKDIVPSLAQPPRCATVCYCPSTLGDGGGSGSKTCTLPGGQVARCGDWCSY